MAARDPRLSQSPGRVLVVDDVESNRDLLRRRLERQGFDVQLACDGRQALDRIGQESFDLVLLDLMMPQMGGDQVLQAIRRQHSPIQLPVIMVTAKDQSQDVVKLLKLGANDYATKPIDFDVLLARMDVQLSRRQAEQERQRLVKALEQAVRRDALTGLYNRHYLDEILGKELEQAHRYRHALSLMVVDLDGFKRVNDELGHLKGDEVLRAFGRLLRQHLRQTDLAFRYGGDEFAVLMSSVVDQPSAAAQRLRKMFQESAAQLGVRGYPLGLSVGTVTWQPGMALDAQDMLRQADVHLYHDKSRQSISQLALEAPAARPAEERTAWVEFQSLFLDSVGELIVATDLDGTIFYANRAFQRWLNLPSSALLGQPLSEAAPAFSRLASKVRAGDLGQEQVLWECPGEDARVLLVTPNRLETDRARLFAHVYVGADVTSLERSNRQLFQTQKFLEKLNAQTALEDVLQLLLEQAVHMLANADSGSALLLNERSGELEFVAAVGWDLQTLQRITIKPELNIQHLKYRDEPAIIVDDLAQFQRQHFSQDTVEKIQSVGVPKSFLSVPIKAEGRILGYFNLNNKQRAGAFAPQDLEAVRSLEPHIALAVKRAREARLLQEHQRRLSLVFQLGQELAQLDTVDEIAQHAADWAVQRYGYDLVGIALMDGQEVRVVAYAGSPSAAAYVGKRSPLGKPTLVARAIRSRNLVRIDDVSQDPEYFEVDSRTRSELVVPICFQDQVLGALNMESFAPAAFGERDEELARFLAGELAIAVTNVRRGEALRQSERRYRALFEHAPAGITLLDAQGNHVETNPHMLRLLGYFQEEAHQLNYRQVIAPEEQADTERRLALLRQGQVSLEPYRKRVVRKDGSKIPLEFLVAPILDERGQLQYILSLTRDVHLQDLLQHQLEHTAVQITTMLARIIDEKDPFTAGHCERMAHRAVQVGRRLDLSPQRLEALRLAALLHDIGKMGVPQELLYKTSPLTDVEWAQVKDHVRIGVELVQSIHPLKDEAAIISQHHERWDGSGYPKSLRGEGILLEARILAVVDAYDAMMSDRPYRRALSPQDARAELRRGAGSQWDPRVVEVLLECPATEP